MTSYNYNEVQIIVHKICYVQVCTKDLGSVAIFFLGFWHSHTRVGVATKDKKIAHFLFHQFLSKRTQVTIRHCCLLSVTSAETV